MSKSDLVFPKIRLVNWPKYIPILG